MAWLNRNVAGMAITSFLSDLGHETATAILPGFLATLGVPPAGLGAIEGIADATSSFVKLGAGWISDRLGHRKAITVAGYGLTGASQAIFAAAAGFPLVLLARTVGWFGRGIRGPLRSAILAGAIEPADRGKAFGFHRAADTLGAVLGPLAAVGLLGLFGGSHPLDAARPYRLVFLLSALPGLGAALTFALMVREKRHVPNRELRFWQTLRGTPPPMRRALAAIGLFGLGDFSHTLLILGAVQLLTPAHGLVRAGALAGLLYVVHNLAYSLAPFPVGAASDRLGRSRLLALGYALGVLTTAALGACMVLRVSSLPVLAAVFAMGGVVLGVEETLEGALVADLAPEPIRGTAYGLLGTVNGLGDLASSLLVGALWTLHPLWGFGYAAALMLAGTVATFSLPAHAR